MRLRNVFLSAVCVVLLAVFLPCGSLLHAQSENGTTPDDKPVITHFSIKHLEELPDDYANVTLVFYAKGAYNRFYLVHTSPGTMALEQYGMPASDSLLVLTKVDRFFDNYFTLIAYEQGGNRSRFAEIVLPAKPTSSVEKTVAEHAFSVEMADGGLQLSNPFGRRGTIVVYDLSGAVMLREDFKQLTHWFAMPARRHSVVVVCVLEDNKPVFSRKIFIE